MAAQEAIEAAALISESLRQLAAVALRHEELALLAFMLDEARDEAQRVLEAMGQRPS